MLITYVYRRQETVAEWVVARTILDVCSIDTGYKGGGRLRVMWWRKKAEEYQIRVTVEAILEEARVRRQQESVRCVRSEGGSEGVITDSKE